MKKQGIVNFQGLSGKISQTDRKPSKISSQTTKSTEKLIGIEPPGTIRKPRLAPIREIRKKNAGKY